MSIEISNHSALCDAELLREVRTLAGSERHATARLIAALGEVDARRLYLAEGCSSLFTYCTQVLHLSGADGHRWWGLRMSSNGRARNNGVQRTMMSRPSTRVVAWTISIGVLFLAFPLTVLIARDRREAAQFQPVPEQVVGLQRAYESARAGRQPAIHLLADAFVEIQADGRVLTRLEAVDKYVRFDDVSAPSLTERRAALFGDVAVIVGRTGEEGTPYSARRLYVWINQTGTWRLLVFQKTFVLSRDAELSSLSAQWPWPSGTPQSEFPDEQTVSNSDPVTLRELVPDDAMLIDAYGEQFTGRGWLAKLTDVKEAPFRLRHLSLLHQGEATVVIGNRQSTATGLESRFTRVWTRADQGMQLRVSQTTLAAAQVFGPKRQPRPSPQGD